MRGCLRVAGTRRHGLPDADRDGDDRLVPADRVGIGFPTTAEFAPVNALTVQRIWEGTSEVQCSHTAACRASDGGRPAADDVVRVIRKSDPRHRLANGLSGPGDCPRTS